MARTALLIKTQRGQEALKKSLEKGEDPRFPTRVYNRCKLCGRGHAYLRFFKICRICFRELANKGAITGVKKSSW